MSGAPRVAERARGTPRIANRLLRPERDQAQVKADGRIVAAVAEARLDLLERDPHGFDSLDRRRLTTRIDKFHAVPVGIDGIAATVAEERVAVEELVEPLLIQQGIQVRTARRRMAIRADYEQLSPRVLDKARRSKHGTSNHKGTHPV